MAAHNVPRVDNVLLEYGWRTAHSGRPRYLGVPAYWQAPRVYFGGFNA